MPAKQPQKDRGLIPGPVVSAQPRQFPTRGERFKPMANGPSPSSTEPMTRKAIARKPKRRPIPAPPAIRPLPSSGGFWTTIATYATELAPVAGPLLEAIGLTANAIDRADQRNRSVEAEVHYLWTDCDGEKKPRNLN
jgi:hypothetical protein